MLKNFRNGVSALLTFGVAMLFWTVLFWLAPSWSSGRHTELVAAVYLIVTGVTAYGALRQYRWHNYVDGVGPQAPPD
jgi:hypothetical protein